ncbi:MAG: Snf7 family protein [Candidatus Freyarchaeota archaeon]|nr:Snf7 family protein [Candidatus Jordarchaeia archaeon]MBS7270165.1 Snf7 family protein [Candidatus Jordarchaeia archaeon]MBS7280208.1 Snf7 family protein [Candidatus Jordarchaeia archaeon]
MSIKDILFGKRPKNKDEIVAQLRTSINRLTLRSRNYERKAIEERNKAKQYLKMGNKGMATFALRKFRRYQNFLGKYTAFIENLETRLIAIEEAHDVSELKEAFELAGAELENARKLVNSEQILEMMIKQEEAMHEISRSSEILATPSEMGVEEAGDIESELNRLEAEIALEGIEEPKVPQGDIITEKSSLASELEDLKRELESSKKPKEKE